MLRDPGPIILKVVPLQQPINEMLDPLPTRYLVRLDGGSKTGSEDRSKTSGNMSMCRILRREGNDPYPTTPQIWVNYSIHGPPTPPTPNPEIWPRTALGPISANRGHRGESIPPIHIQKCCNRTDFEPKNGLAHVCSSLPSTIPQPPGGRVIFPRLPTGPASRAKRCDISDLSQLPLPPTLDDTFLTSARMAQNGRTGRTGWGRRDLIPPRFPPHPGQSCRLRVPSSGVGFGWGVMSHPPTSARRPVGGSSGGEGVGQGGGGLSSSGGRGR